MTTSRSTILAALGLIVAAPALAAAEDGSLWSDLATARYEYATTQAAAVQTDAGGPGATLYEQLAVQQREHAGQRSRGVAGRAGEAKYMEPAGQIAASPDTTVYEQFRR